MSEAITIYLAVGASFGAYNFLRDEKPASRFHTWLEATRVMILWPLASAKFLYLRQRKAKVRLSNADGEQQSAPFSWQIEQASGKLLSSLYRMVELAKVSSGGESEKMEMASRSVREAVEKYVGLTMAAAEINLEALPSEREMELFRVAGRKGDDLLLAGRCIQRRNAARVINHQARARTGLLHTLAEIREVCGAVTSPLNVQAARHLSVETLRFYACAFDLLSLLEDETAARSVARLLDAECARLRRLEALSQKETRSNAREERGPRHTTPIRLSALEQSMEQSSPLQ